jgi:hypothetical protein
MSAKSFGTLIARLGERAGRPPQHPAHGQVHRASAGSVQELLAVTARPFQNGAFFRDGQSLLTSRLAAITALLFLDRAGATICSFFPHCEISFPAPFYNDEV